MKKLILKDDYDIDYLDWSLLLVLIEVHDQDYFYYLV
jgi:hypothetical protein